MFPEGLQEPGSEKPFTCNKVLIVEGKDTWYFFKALLEYLRLRHQIEIRNYAGNTDLPDYLEALPAISGFHEVASLGIVRDAERQEVDAAFQSVCGGLERAGLGVPDAPMATSRSTPQVSVYILPDCSHSGMLETLCIQTVAGDPALPCIDQYYECLRAEGVGLPRNMPKARAQAFLASRPRFVAHVGEAAHRGYWTWGSPALDQLKQFLNAL